MSTDAGTAQPSNNVPDTDANFQQYAAGSTLTNVVQPLLTFVNNTGSPSALPSDIPVSFSDSSGNFVGQPTQANVTGNQVWGLTAISGTNGEQVTPDSLFNPGQTVVESPSINPYAPQQPDLSCSASLGGNS